MGDKFEENKVLRQDFSILFRRYNEKELKEIEKELKHSGQKITAEFEKI